MLSVTVPLIIATIFPAVALGIGLGLLITLPAAYLWSRRTARRVRQLEQEAFTNERLAEIGTMTSGLAHEIKNPLSTLGLNVQLMREDITQMVEELEEDDPHRERLSRTNRRFDALNRETQRLKDILEDFLSFAGRMELDLQPTDIHQSIDELVDFFEPQAEEAKVRLRVQLSASPSVVNLDIGLFKQALLNLMLNAVQAMATTRDTEASHGGCDELLIRTDIQKPDRLCVHVIDTGPGMSDETQSRIFEPYFSTKRSGSGLGLPTSRRIIEEHSGYLNVNSDLGKGTAFVISLPLI